MDDDLKIWVLFRKQGIGPRIIRGWWVLAPTLDDIKPMVPPNTTMQQLTAIALKKVVDIQVVSSITHKQSVVRVWLDEVAEGSVIKAV